MSKIEKYRIEAFEKLKLCELYKGEDWAKVPLDYARRWAHVFENTNVDLDKLKEIVIDIEQERGSYGISLDLFLMGRRKIYQELLEDYLRNQFEKQFAPNEVFK